MDRSPRLALVCVMVVGEAETEGVARYLGNGMPVPSANAVATVPRIVESARIAAKARDRKVR